MNDKELKATISKFPKHVSATTKREIEKAIRTAVASGPRDHRAAVGVTSEKSDLQQNRALASHSCGRHT
jgi:N12 class adenine-specific DNA methylase